VIALPIVSRFARAWPEHAEQPCPICSRKGKACDGPGNAEYMPIADAFARVYDDDAHVAAYSVPSIEYRLSLHASTRIDGGVPMVALFVDVEPEGHAPRTEAWDNAEQPKIERAIADGWYAYETRGGYRLVRPLAKQFIIDGPHAAQVWSASYLAALDDVRSKYGIDGDRTCADWPRLYRLPFVVRDGVQQHPDVAGLTTMRPYAMRVVDAPAPSALVATSTPSEFGAASPELIEHVRQRLRAHGPAIEGQGGDHHTYTACAIVVNDYALSDDECTLLLDEWNSTCVPPWDGDELRTKLDNAFNYTQSERGSARSSWECEQRIGRGLARRFERQAVSTITHELSEFDGAPIPRDESPWGLELERALTDVTSLLGTSVAIGTPQPLFMPATELLRQTYADDPWLIRNLVKRGGTALISGEPKTAKTWALTEAAVAMSTGTKAFGEFATGVPLRVAYFYAEDLPADVQAHIRALAVGRGMDPADAARNLFVQPRGRFLDVLRDEDLALLIASVRRLGGVDVLCLEPLRDLHSGEEDKSDAMREVMRRLRLLGEILNCTMMGAHHSGKSTGDTSKRRGGQRMRGSGAIHGAIDAGIYLSLPGGNGENEITSHVDVEVKGARAAGSFDWTLRIDDDMHGRSTRAVWTVARALDAARAAETRGRHEQHDDIAKVVDFVRKLQSSGSAALFLTKLRTSVPDVPDKRCRVAVGRALREGYLRSGTVNDPKTFRTLPGERITIGDKPFGALAGVRTTDGAS
jgi:hypothetical protein